MGSDTLGYLLYTADDRFPSPSRGGAGLGPRPATCSAVRPRSRPGRWRASLPTRTATASMTTASSIMWSCRCFQLGPQQPRAVGRACRGSADPEGQPAAAGGQAAGAPPGLGAGRPIHRAPTMDYHRGQEPSVRGLNNRRREPQLTARSVAWCSMSDWSAPVGSGLLRLDASSIQTDPDRSRRIVWMIKRMIKPRRDKAPASRGQATTGEITRLRLYSSAQDSSDSRTRTYRSAECPLCIAVGSTGALEGQEVAALVDLVVTWSSGSFQPSAALRPSAQAWRSSPCFGWRAWSWVWVAPRPPRRSPTSG